MTGVVRDVELFVRWWEVLLTSPSVMPVFETDACMCAMVGERDLPPVM